MKKLYEEEDIQKLADSIRNKTYKDDKMKVSEMSEEIDGIDLERNLVKFIQGELTTLRIDVASVDFSPFYCQGTNLRTVICTPSQVVTATTSGFLSSNTNLESIYVPDDLVDSYKSATNWVTYADKIKPMSEYQS